MLYADDRQLRTGKQALRARIFRFCAARYLSSYVCVMARHLLACASIIDATRHTPMQSALCMVHEAWFFAPRLLGNCPKHNHSSCWRHFGEAPPLFRLWSEGWLWATASKTWRRFHSGLLVPPRLVSTSYTHPKTSRMAQPRNKIATVLRDSAVSFLSSMVSRRLDQVQSAGSAISLTSLVVVVQSSSLTTSHYHDNIIH